MGIGRPRQRLLGGFAGGGLGGSLAEQFSHSSGIEPVFLTAELAVDPGLAFTGLDRRIRLFAAQRDQHRLDPFT